MHKQFIENIRAHQLFDTADKLIIAVSGGVDSVVLCELCYRSGFSFAMAHANFQLRGEESEADEQFVRALAEKYNVPVHVKLFETRQYAAAGKVSVQVAARELRYAWFHELLNSGFRWLLTAHHADDNIETMLMNFFRGTGISGLRGILPKANHTIRPLLPFTKETILAFANENGLHWREDSSNDSDKYTRNYFRHQLVPLAKYIYPEAENNLLQNAPRLREAEELYLQAIALHKKRLMEVRGNEIHIPVLKLKKAIPLRTILHEIIKPFHFSAHQLDDALKLLDAGHGKFIKSATHRIIRNRDWLIITENENARPDFLIIEKDQSEAGGGVLKMNYSGSPEISKDPFTASLDAKEMNYPLLFRKWKQGDYFYPLGMPKKKRVSRFLIDLKLSPTEKEKVMVLESGKRICWVAGLRIDDRFRITPSTKKMLEIVFDPQVLK